MVLRTGRRGTGTLRERRPGVWEIRVCVGTDLQSGQPLQRSVTVHGELAEAEQRRAMLAAQAEQLRERRRPPLRTVAELLAVWLVAAHDWKPSTWRGYRQAARRISLTSLAERRPDAVSPPVLRAALHEWQRAGVAESTVALHARTLKAALGWAFDERLIVCQPLIGWRGPRQSAPRRDVPVEIVRALLVSRARRGRFGSAGGAWAT